MSFGKVIIWGFPLHTHTHSYIHAGWHKGFKHLGYETHWFDDNNVPTDFDFSNCLFITEGYADKNIPINDSSIYFVHIAIDPKKYIGHVKRFIEIRYLVDSIKDCNYNYTLNKWRCTKISECTYYEKLINNGGLAKSHDEPEPMDYECIYTCWATDLLPSEIDDENAHRKRDDKIYWFGSSNQHNTKEIAIFYEECRRTGVEFIANDPWQNPLPFDVVQEYTMKSLIAPDFRSSGDPRKIALGETGTCHKQNGYIPCRLLKAISYGHLGITNSRHAYELLEKSVVYNDNERLLFYDAVRNVGNHDLIKKQMAIVREKHTYLNRIQDLLNVLLI
uniref:Glycosyltransferase n=1 Tax=viral metagenome TaxID=1070528 RepID=A0A6C0B853_9ZZZZ